jgi:hypothetical protein
VRAGLHGRVRIVSDYNDDMTVALASCPTCGAQKGYPCRFPSGGIKYRPHDDREESATQIAALERMARRGNRRTETMAMGIVAAVIAAILLVVLVMAYAPVSETPAPTPSWTDTQLETL